jgi:hypothetical protein
MIFMMYDWISGMSLGIEFINDEEEKQNIIIIDILILRLIFSKGYE